MNNDRRRREDRAYAMRAEANRLRDLAMATSNPLRAIWLTLAARRCEARARDIKDGKVDPSLH